MLPSGGQPAQRSVIRPDMVWIVSVASNTPNSNCGQHIPQQSELTTSSGSESEDNSENQNGGQGLVPNNKPNKSNSHTSSSSSSSRITIPITYAEPFTGTLTDGDSSSVGSKHSLDSEGSVSPSDHLVTSLSSPPTLQMMNTKKWLGLKSGDKNFRQQYDGMVYQNEKKQKKPKTRKKSDADSISDPDEEPNGDCVDEVPECGKENSLSQPVSCKKIHSLPHSFSSADRQPPRHQLNSSRQRTEINNNVQRRTCRYLSESSVPSPRSTTTTVQRQLSQHSSRKVNKSPVSTTKRLTKSQHNLSNNFDYANRSQSLGDLTTDQKLSLPNNSRKSHEAASTRVSSATSSRTSTLGRRNSQVTSQKTTSGPHYHRVDKSKSFTESQSHSSDTLNSNRKSQPSDTLHRTLSKSSLYPSRLASSQHDNQHSFSSTTQSRQGPQVHVQKQGSPLQKTLSDAHQRYRNNKFFQPQNASLSRQTNKISKANSVPQPEGQTLYKDPAKPVIQVQMLSKSNVLEQHRKYGSTDSINKLKTRRSLPRVPSQSIDEKRRKFTELMKQRILLCSAGSSNNSQHGDTPLDYEVSSLLSLNDIEPDESCSDKVKFKPIESAADVCKFRSLQDLSVEADIPPQTQPPSEWKQVIPVVCIENSGSSNLSSQINNARSHSSTMDSGYGTIDMEMESCHSSSRLKAPGYLRPELDKRLVKMKEYGSVDCLSVNTVSSSKNYLHQHSPRTKQEQEYSNLLSAKSASLYNGSKWEPKSVSSQALYSSSSRKSEHSHRIQEKSKSFSQSMNPWRNNLISMNSESSISSIPTLSQSGMKSPVTPTPDSVPNATLYQLIQMYNLYPVHLDVYNHCITNYLCLQRTSVHLPTPTSFGKSSPCCSGGQHNNPQGKYAKLGGPGSAFRPVRGCGASLSSMCEVSVTAVKLKTDGKSPPPLGLLSIEDGDFLVEINGVVVLEESVKTIQRIIDQTTLSLQLILAHPKQSVGCRSFSSCSDVSSPDDVHALKERIKQLLTELDLKEKVIQERSSAQNFLFSSSSSSSSSSTSSSSSIKTPNHNTAWLGPSPQNRAEPPRQYYDDWEKNLESIKLGEDEFVV
ncbi:uncharacterized protein LOC115230820 isoform X1 [Argonauta hians]